MGRGVVARAFWSRRGRGRDYNRAVPDPLFAPVARIDAALDRLLPSAAAVPRRLHRAMRYSLFAGGKRLRPLLVYHAYRACGGRGAAVFRAAAALEMIHVYSLIHDDLPAMDDDDMRRGRPTLHRRFDEATAILAGDALLTHAFGAVAEGFAPAVSARIVREMVRAAGTAGMIGGQALDLAAEGRPPRRRTVVAIHARKTAALIAGAARIGAIAAGAPWRAEAALFRYGRALGLAFQIVDDILDETGDARRMGKPVRRDMENGKMTYPCAVGLAAARREADRLTRRALAAVSRLGPAADPLRRLARLAVDRTS